MLKDIFYSLLLVAVFIVGAVFGGSCVMYGVRQAAGAFQQLIKGYFDDLYMDKGNTKE